MAHADEALDILLSGARSAAGLSQPPQLLIVMTACMSRLGWKYSSIAYALALKEFGAAAQTMYLVATAMNVAPCMLGGGDSSAFARASGVSALDEPSIGEFMLGSIPAAEHPRSAKTAPRHPDA